MVDVVLNERRREARQAPASPLSDREPQIPGARVVEVIDTSTHGLRCRLASPVRPGRPMPLRLPTPSGPIVMPAFVVRCEVCRLTRQGVHYEAAWAFEKAWSRG